MNFRVRLGLYLTTGWVAIWGLLLFIHWSEAIVMKFNEWGDFFAGVFAPLAFLWLVIGYFQQGEELRQNTQAIEQQERALMLQVEELKQSVEQQKEMVNVSRLSLNADQEADKRTYLLKKKAARPDFTDDGGFVGQRDASNGGYENYQLIKFGNLGGTMRSVKFRLVEGEGSGFLFLGEGGVEDDWEQFNLFELQTSKWKSGQLKKVFFLFNKWHQSDQLQHAFTVNVSFIDDLDENSNAMLYFYLQPNSACLTFSSEKLG